MSVSLNFNWFHLIRTIDIDIEKKVVFFFNYNFKFSMIVFHEHKKNLYLFITQFLFCSSIPWSYYLTHSFFFSIKKNNKFLNLHHMRNSLLSKILLFSSVQYEMAYKQAEPSTKYQDCMLSQTKSVTIKKYMQISSFQFEIGESRKKNWYEKKSEYIRTCKLG